MTSICGITRRKLKNKKDTNLEESKTAKKANAK